MNRQEAANHQFDNAARTLNEHRNQTVRIDTSVANSLRALAECSVGVGNALLDIADAIRETKTEQAINVTQHLDSFAVAQAIRAHLDGESE